MEFINNTFLNELYLFADCKLIGCPTGTRNGARPLTRAMGQWTRVKILKSKGEGVNVARGAVDLHWDLLQVKGAIRSWWDLSLRLY